MTEQAWSGFLEFLRLFVAASLSAWLSGYIVRRWQYREDHLERRVEDLIDEIGSLANAAIDYWLIGPPGSTLNDADRIQSQEKVLRLGARITALQHQTAAIRASIQNEIDARSISALAIRESFLFDAASGGEFGVASRSADPTRVRMISGAAANYIIDIRTARDWRLRRRWLRR